jgi:hypothetical protein
MTSMLRKSILMGGVFLMFSVSLAFTTSGADALTGRTLAFQFGGEGSTGGELMRPTKVAIDETDGNVYVTEEENRRVSEFGPAGDFILTFGDEVNETKKSDVCTAVEVEHEGVTCKSGALPEGEAQFFRSPTYVAVDNSNGPDKGDVYVVDGELKRIDIFTEDGRYLSQIDSAQAGSTEPFEPVAIAVGGTSQLYVATSDGTVDTFAAGYQYTGKISREGLSGAVGLAVDDTGNLYEETAQEVVDYGPQHNFLATLYEEPSGSGAELNGVAVGGSNGASDTFLSGEIEKISYEREREVAAVTPDGTFTFGAPQLEGRLPGGVAYSSYNHDVYLVGVRQNEVFAYSEAGTLPGIHSLGPASVARTTATVRAQIEPEGLTGEYSVQYGKIRAAESEQEGGTVAGNAATTVNATLHELQPETTYYYRLYETASSAATTFGEWQTLTTPAAVSAVQTAGASAIGPEAATVSGSLEPEGETAQAYFEYTDEEPLGGPATQVTQTAPTNGTGVVPMQAMLAQLQPDTVYRYRLSAMREIEGETYTVHGSEGQFVTLPRGPTSLTTPATEVSAFSATLEGEVNPKNGVSTYWFEYGTTTVYGLRTPSEGPLGGVEVVPVAQIVEGLVPSAEYHDRLVVESAYGRSYGQDIAFATAAGTTRSLASPLSPTGSAVAPGAVTGALGIAASPAPVPIPVFPTLNARPATRSKAPTKAQRLAGVLRACAKKAKSKRIKCEMQAKKLYGKKGSVKEKA